MIDTTVFVQMRTTLSSSETEGEPDVNDRSVQSPSVIPRLPNILASKNIGCI